ncbi:hypothetical protein SESBI_50735 [Sesbania bispinosa]|nr:hypothetical protein SESBI_50735 [Sesbania bispinosa]
MDGAGSSRNQPQVFDFKLEINLTLEHIEFPRHFYDEKKDELRYHLDLHDPRGNMIRTRLFYRDRVVILFDIIPQLVDLYGLNRNCYMYLSYEGENKCYIEIKDEEMDEIQYPAPVGQQGNMEEIIHQNDEEVVAELEEVVAENDVAVEVEFDETAPILPWAPKEWFFFKEIPRSQV